MKVLACGSNGNYQLGTGHDEDVNVLTEIHVPVDDPDYIIKFACGGNHTLILFRSGRVVSCGNNEFGQCGFGTELHQIKRFRLVPGFWADIAAGWEYSVFLDADGHVYTCGNGPKGELGLGPVSTSRDLQQVPLPAISRIYLSINHVIALTEDGVCYGWGACRKGQMGPVSDVTQSGKPVLVYWSPKLLDFPKFHPDFLALGHDRSVLYTPQSKSITIMGKNPYTIDCDGLIKLSSMWSSVHWRSTHDSLVSSSGNNLHGQLFDYDVPNNEKIQNFETGSEHGLLLTTSNRVLAWGWGEHGNCGKQKDLDHVTFDFLNPIYDGTDPVVLMAGGCATTWVVVSSTPQ